MGAGAGCRTRARSADDAYGLVTAGGVSLGWGYVADVESCLTALHSTLDVAIGLVKVVERRVLRLPRDKQTPEQELRALPGISEEEGELFRDARDGLVHNYYAWLAVVITDDVTDLAILTHRTANWDTGEGYVLLSRIDAVLAALVEHIDALEASLAERVGRLGRWLFRRKKAPPETPAGQPASSPGPRERIAVLGLAGMTASSDAWSVHSFPWSSRGETSVVADYDVALVNLLDTGPQESFIARGLPEEVDGNVVLDLLRAAGQILFVGGEVVVLGHPDFHVMAQSSSGLPRGGHWDDAPRLTNLTLDWNEHARHRERLQDLHARTAANHQRRHHDGGARDERPDVRDPSGDVEVGAGERGEPARRVGATISRAPARRSDPSGTRPAGTSGPPAGSGNNSSGPRTGWCRAPVRARTARTR